MKVNANDLFKVMRQVIREELKKSLPEMIRQQLAENYVKKIVSETVHSNKTKSMREIITADDHIDEDEVPRPQLNTDRGIYNNNSELAKKNEGTSKLISKSNPMSFIYENVNMSGEDSEVNSIPLSAFNQNFEHMNNILEATKDNNKREISQSDESKMRELEARRKALEVPAIRGIK
jgi:hypothetical protein